MKTKVFLAALAVLATVGFASAQNQAPATQTKATKSCFVDTNNNGVCDKHEDGTCTMGNGKGLQDGSGQGKGLRDGSGRKNGAGKGEAVGKRDGSGRANGQGMRRGHGKRNGNGSGHGPNHVDANNNGICDHIETTK